MAFRVILLQDQCSPIFGAAKGQFLARRLMRTYWDSSWYTWAADLNGDVLFCCVYVGRTGGEPARSVSRFLQLLPGWMDNTSIVAVTAPLATPAITGVRVAPKDSFVPMEELADVVEA